MLENPANVTEVELMRRAPRGRLFELDALRGLAAFAVVGYHLRLAYNFNYPVSRNPLVALLLSGHQAVVLFFVLSGYVLGMPYWTGRQMPYRRYLVRRFFRIYIPFLAALLLSWSLAHFFLYSRLPLSRWFYLTWQTPLSWGLFGRQLLMSMDPAINTAFWSLRVEAEFSILLPVCCWLVLRLHPLFTAMLCGSIYVAGWYASNVDEFRTSQYFPMFFIGLLLSFHAERLTAWWQARSPALRFMFFIMALVFYLPVAGQNRSFADASTGLGAGMIVLCALNSKVFSRTLRHRVPEYLGRISYSLYLVHATALFALMNLLYWRTTRIVLVCVIYACALLLAHVFCIAIEEPAMRAGKRLTSPRLPITQREPAQII